MVYGSDRPYFKQNQKTQYYKILAYWHYFLKNINPKNQIILLLFWGQTYHIFLLFCPLTKKLTWFRLIYSKFSKFAYLKRNIYWKFPYIENLRIKSLTCFKHSNQHNCCATVLSKFLLILISLLGKWSIYLQ